jgi:membrane-bound lytic murein transglycosylase D
MKNSGIAAVAGLLATMAFTVGVDRGARLVNQGTPSPAPRGSLTDTVTPEAPDWDIPNLDHERVDYWIGRFQTDKRQDIQAFMSRKGRYETLIAGALAEHEMPQDLVYLAMIESGFDPKAYSSARASGLWQFIAGTAERYGLDINRAVDERNDPEKATHAALSYLSDLHARFGSWYLAAAAYNTGENRITRILREQLGRARGTDEDYYAIWDHLPRETRDYVPLMVAAARIGKDPARYGIAPIEAVAMVPVSTVVAAPATPLKTIARQAKTTVAMLKRLNPHLKLDRTRNDEEMIVRVPEASRPGRALLAD